jgi:ornithine decarboxylase
VGSQNSRPASWGDALIQAGYVARNLSRKGIRLGMVNAGGGFPAQYFKDIPFLESIAQVIINTKEEHFKKNVQLCVEPGRGLVAEAGVLVTTVINRTIRNGENWLYVDAGIFHGLYEAREGFRFPIMTKKEKDPISEFIGAGPSCDSVDVIMENISLPSTLTYGDELYFQTTGAYTTSMERYNGIDYPPIFIIE